MISRITGCLRSADETSARVEVGGVCLDVHIPRSATEELSRRIGQEITLHTVFYLEGNAVGANFSPRLLGFLNETDRGFFNAFTRVKGVGMRKALRAMSVPADQIAAAIEAGDERSLTALPEIGRKMAAQIVTDLRGQLGEYVLSRPTPSAQPARTFTDAQHVAINILVEWGDRRLDAERLVASAIEADAKLIETEQIVKAAYRLKQLGHRS